MFQSPQTAHILSQTPPKQLTAQTPPHTKKAIIFVIPSRQKLPPFRLEKRYFSLFFAQKVPTLPSEHISFRTPPMSVKEPQDQGSQVTRFYGPKKFCRKNQEGHCYQVFVAMNHPIHKITPTRGRFKREGTNYTNG